MVAHVILVSALGPNPFFFFFWGTFIQLGGLSGPGFGPGLDNKGVEPESMVSEPESRSYGWEPESMVQEPESMV